MENFINVINAAISGTSNWITGETTLTEVHNNIQEALSALDIMRDRLVTIANGIKIHHDVKKSTKTVVVPANFKKRCRPVGSKNKVSKENETKHDAKNPGEYVTRNMKNRKGGYTRICGNVAPRGTWKQAAEDYMKANGFIVNDADAVKYSSSDPNWSETMIHVHSTNPAYAYVGFWMKDSSIVLGKKLTYDNRRSIASHIAANKFGYEIPQISIAFSKAKHRSRRRKAVND